MKLFFIALGLVFVIEGVLPFISPHSWRVYVIMIVKRSDRFLRILGLVSMLLGLSFIFFTQHLL